MHLCVLTNRLYIIIYMYNLIHFDRSRDDSFPNEHGEARMPAPLFQKTTKLITFVICGKNSCL